MILLLLASVTGLFPVFFSVGGLGWFDPSVTSVSPLPDDEALAAFKALSEHEGIISALESAHALAHALKIIEEDDKDQIIIVNSSGRGDKDIFTVAKSFEERGMIY